MTTDDDISMRRIMVGLIVAVLTASLIGWGSWISTFAMSHRERIVALEQRYQKIEDGQCELKEMMKEVRNDVKQLTVNNFKRR